MLLPNDKDFCLLFLQKTNQSRNDMAAGGIISPLKTNLMQIKECLCEEKCQQANCCRVMIGLIKEIPVNRCMERQYCGKATFIFSRLIIPVLE